MLARSGHGDVEQTLLFFGASEAGIFPRCKARRDRKSGRCEVRSVPSTNRTVASASALRLPSMPVWQPARMTIGNSKPLDLWMLMMRTASRFSSASTLSPSSLTSSTRFSSWRIASLSVVNPSRPSSSACCGKLLQIGHCLLAVKIAGREQLHRQRCEHMRDRGSDRQGAGLFVQARERVVKLGQGRRKIFAGEFCRGAVVEQVLPVQFVNLLIGESAQRRAQHADQRQTVVGIFHRAQQIDGVDDFFRGVKMALAFDDVANSLTAQGFQVVVNVGELAQQNRDVFRLRMDFFAARVQNRGFA